MNNLQEDKLSAYEAVWTLLNTEDSRVIWMGNVYFAALVNEMGELIDAIREALGVQNTNNTGVALEKMGIRKELIDAAMIVVYGAVAHAVITGDVELKNAIDYRKRSLVKSRDNVLADVASVIYNIAYPLRDELAAKLVTAADIERVRELRDAFLGMIAAPRAMIVEKKGATENLKAKLKAMDDLLYGKIDVVIKIYSGVQREFVERYFKARKIVRTGVRHTGARVKGRVVEAETGKGIGGARVMMPEKKRERVTDAGGYFKFLLKKRCSVSLVAEATGYKRAVKGPIGIEPGKGVEVEIELMN